MTLATPRGYAPQSSASLADYLTAVATVREVLGGNEGSWKVAEIGDGNLNLVFIVRGPNGGVAVKQALPYVRLVGEGWPLPLSRAHFEHMALREQARLTGMRVPRILHYDEEMALIVMELLEPHIILRRGMISATVYPGFPGAISDFMARLLFFTSDLALDAGRKKSLIAGFAGNTALCRITEDLVFTDPYHDSPRNRWTSPQLDGFARRWREDAELKIAVSRLKLKFLSSAEALLHGDLHTGSVMVTNDDTRVIDPEFAFMGPMGFDTGAILANLLINYFSHDGHEARPGERDGYREWVLAAFEDIWTEFRATFIALWRANPSGDAYPEILFRDPGGAERLQAEREAYMDRLWLDTLGFAGAKMIRRVLGLAHNADLETIAGANIRAECEGRILEFARGLLVRPGDYPAAPAVTAAARQMRRFRPALNSPGA